MMHLVLEIHTEEVYSGITETEEKELQHYIY